MTVGSTVSVVMEGVESLEQAAKAKAAGCSAISFRIPQVDPIYTCALSPRLGCVAISRIPQLEFLL
jgi:hypothetical protein